MGKYAAPKSNSEKPNYKANTSDFENISKSKDFDDDGYEEGKSKERETFLSLSELLQKKPGASAEASREEMNEASKTIRDELKVKKGKKNK